MKSTLNFKLFALLAIIIVGSGIGYSIYAEPENGETLLQGKIILEPTKTIDGDGRIQPGTPVKLKLKVENKGNHSSAGGQAYIRFGFMKPLDKVENSSIFQTEKISLPIIEPGQSVELSFKENHQLPSVIDFIKQDWLMREYQGVIEVDSKEKPIATLSLTFSAYYYPSISKELSDKVPSSN